jgi:hypothetical protein
VEISHPAFSGPTSIILTQDQPNAAGAGAPVPATKGGKEDRKGNSTPKVGSKTATQQPGSSGIESVLNLIELSVNPSKPATYPCFVILKSLDRTDIRLYEFKVNAIPQKIKAQLEFKVPARGGVTQEIPIVNNSQKEWTVTANLDQ